MKQVQSLIVQQARLVANSRSTWTHESNTEFMKRMGIAHPVERLRQAILNRQRMDTYLDPLLFPAEAQLQWRHILLNQVTLAEWGSSDLGAARVVPVDRVIDEVFECPECSQQFSTPAALKRHRYLQHLAEGGKLPAQGRPSQIMCCTVQWSLPFL